MTPEQQRALALARARMAAAQGGVSTNSEAVGEFKGKMGALMDGLHNGVTFGFGDNLSGARAAMFGAIDDQGRMSGDMSGTMGERYRNEVDRYRAQQGQSRQAEPGLYGAGNIAGAMVPAAAAGPIATGQGLLGTTGRSMVAGGVEGALHGAGNADGEDVARQAGIGAGAGAALGLAAPAVIKGAAMAKNAAKDPATGIVDTLTNRANKGKANRAIAEAMMASRKSPDELGEAVMRAAQEGQPEFRLMDAMGIPGQRKASGVARGGGDAGAEIAEFLQQRQAGQPERVSSFIDEGFGLGGETAEQVTENLTQSRNQAADAAYSAARGNAAPVDVRGALAVIDDRIGGMQGSNIAGDSIDGKLARYRSRLAADPAPDGEISRELSDFDRVLGVKQAIQDDIGAAVRAGRNNEARELGKLVTALDEALEASSDMYRTANDGYREASRAIDAVGQGAAMSRPSMRAQDTTAQFSAMTPDQQQAARAGYGDRLLAQTEANSSPTSNRAKPLQSPKRSAEADAMTLDPELYTRRLQRENEMWETQNRALQGSRTADNLEDVSSTNEIASGMGGAAESALNINVGTALRKLGGMLAPMAKGQNEATRQMIARALMSQNPQEVLAPALRQEMSSQSMRRIWEALLRNSGREQYMQSVQ